MSLLLGEGPDKGFEVVAPSPNGRGSKESVSDD
jgi:hypothetical protein